MHISHLFISRPVATTLLTLAVALIGFGTFFLLPVAPLPEVDFPTIRVYAVVPGASPETMASTVATPLERTLGRIAGISDMNSFSVMGITSIAIQFEYERDINGAARDVQAAINAARAILPTMPTNPIYRKLNPADAPVMIIGLTSDTVPIGELYNLASTILSQKISQIYGVGSVQVQGSSLPAVRVDLEPGLVSNANISLETIRTIIGTSNVTFPKGVLDDGTNQWFVGANDQLYSPEDFASLIVRHNNFGTLKLSDVATVHRGHQDQYNAGYVNGRRGVVLIIYKEPGSNMIATIERVKESLPLLKAWTPDSVNLEIIMDRSPTIKASLVDVEITLVIAMLLVVLIVYLFLRDARATFIPAVAVPVSLLGTFVVMYFFGYSLNHLSLMALTIATGFVVDDAIVVTENIVRYVEKGMDPVKAAYIGSKEVAFTVISISLSLIAIFIPILGLGGLVGEIFREFSVTLSAAVMVSLVISLVTTPMMCAMMLKPHHVHAPVQSRKTLSRQVWHSIYSVFSFPMTMWGWLIQGMQTGYEKSLAIVLRYKFLTLLSLLVTIVLNVYLYTIVPKGFFPPQDTGLVIGTIRGDQNSSFQSMQPKAEHLIEIIRSHRYVAAVGGSIGGWQRNTGVLFFTLLPKNDRDISTQEVVNELRDAVKDVAGVEIFFRPIEDLGSGSKQQAQATYNYSLMSDDLATLRYWAEIITEHFKTIPGMVDVKSDQEVQGLQTEVTVNRSTIARLGITQKQIDSALSLAFAQSFASTIYEGINQYRVVMGYAPAYLESPESLKDIYVPTGGNRVTQSAAQTGISGNRATSVQAQRTTSDVVPLSSLATFSQSFTPLSVSRDAQMSAANISFNLLPGYSLSEVTPQIDQAIFDLGVPSSVRAGFDGMGKLFKQTVGDQPILILSAFLSLYIVLGILYESLIHPLTILSTLPSAGVGAILALILFDAEFTVIAFIGVLLLCGIVKKNAIMMIDFAIEARRTEGLNAHDAIYKACILRFRPIMMTTLAAIFGALPLLFGHGEGAELRTPLGITIIGGLLVSQVLTLYTTPVIYLYLDRFTKQPKPVTIELIRINDSVTS